LKEKIVAQFILNILDRKFVMETRRLPLLEIIVVEFGKILRRKFLRCRSCAQKVRTKSCNLR